MFRLTSATTRALALLTLLAAWPAAPAPLVTITAREGELDIHIDREAVARYVWGDENLPRPYFHALITPDGIQVSRNYPPDPAADGNNDDHAHFHPGAWLAFGDAAGADFWRNKARVRHLTFLVPPTGGDGQARFTVVNAYETTGDAPRTLFTETCAYLISAHEDGYTIVAESEFKPEGDAFTFGDQEEMGFGVRLATPLTVKHGGGAIRNSAGGEQEAGTWGKTAAWCAGYSVVDGRTAGIAVMASPDNFRPAWFHSRDYGLIVANPFGKKAMTAPRDASVAPDATPVPADGTLHVGFGLYVFSAPAGEAPDVDAMYNRYLDARKPIRP